MRIKTQDQLPNWFSVEKYAGCKDLNLVAWAELLTYRTGVSYSMKNEQERKDVTPLLLHLREKPLDRYYTKITKDEDGNITWQDFNPLKFKTYLSPKDYRAAYALTCYDFFYLNSTFCESLREKCINQEGSYDESASLHNEYTSDCTELVAINLNRPDSEIMSSIENILQQNKIRRSQPERKPRLEDCSYWAKSGVLPFIDLKIWEQETNNKITNEVFANTLTDYYNNIFHDENEKSFTKDDIRKSVLVLARKLIQPSYIKWLSNQAGYEQGIHLTLDTEIVDEKEGSYFDVGITI